MNMKFKDEYIKWLYDNTDEYKVSDNVYRITLPFLNRNNDCTEIFIKLDGDKYLLTDDGETINELELSGFNLFSSLFCRISTIVIYAAIQSTCSLPVIPF